MRELTLNKLVIAILVTVIVIVASIVLLFGDKSTNTNANIDNLSEEKILEIKESYELDGKKEEFEDLYNNLEEAVAGKFLDGTVTSEAELQEEIVKINKMLKTTNWEYLNVEYTDFWMGTWSLDKTGKLYFTFANEGIKPDWISETSLNEYVK